MKEKISHDRLIAKLQHFAEAIKQVISDLENLVVLCNDNENCKSEIRTKILVYNQVLEEYHRVFEEILYKD